MQSRDLAARFEAYSDWRRRLSSRISGLHEWLSQQELADAYPQIRALGIRGSENPNLLPKGAITFMPQKPYFPVGTLRDAIGKDTLTISSADAAKHGLRDGFNVEVDVNGNTRAVTVRLDDKAKVPTIPALDSDLVGSSVTLRKIGRAHV